MNDTDILRATDTDAGSTTKTPAAYETAVYMRNDMSPTIEPTRDVCRPAGRAMISAIQDPFFIATGMNALMTLRTQKRGAKKVKP